MKAAYRDVRARLRQSQLDPYGAALVVLTLIAAWLRACDLGGKSLWYDEAVLYWIARSPIASLSSVNALENSAPPLYALLVHFVSAISTDEAALRSLSWVAGSLTIPAFYLLARNVVSRGAALAATSLIVLAPAFVQYSQQLREYSLTLLLSVLMLLAYSKYREADTGLHLGLFVFVSLVGLFTQYGLALLVLSLGVAYLIEGFFIGRRWGGLPKWLVAQAILLVAVGAVWWSSLQYQFTTDGFGHLTRGYFQGSLASLIPFLSRQTYELVLFAFPDPPLLILLIGTAIVSAVAGGGLTRVHIHLVVPFVVAAGAGVVGVYPYVGARQSMYLQPLVYLLCAIGFEYALRVDARRILPSLLLILMARAALIPTLGYLRWEGDENLRPVVEYLEANLEPADRIFVCPGAIPAFRYYYDGDLSQAIEGEESEVWQAQFAGILETPVRVWLVAAHCGDVSTYVEFAARRRPTDLALSAANAWLYLSP